MAERPVVHRLLAEVEAQIAEAVGRIFDGCKAVFSPQLLLKALGQSQRVQHKVNVALLQRKNGGVLAAVDGVDSAFRVGAFHVFQNSFAFGFAIGGKFVEPGGGGGVRAVGIQRDFRPAERVVRVPVLPGEGAPLPLIKDEAPGAGFAFGYVRVQHFLLLGGVAGLSGLGNHRFPVGPGEYGHKRQPELPSRQARLLLEENLQPVRAIGFGVVEILRVHN